MLRLSVQLFLVLDWLRSVAPTAQLSADSRSIVAGDVFLAYPGDSADGRAFIGNAIQNQAAAILYDPKDFDWSEDWDIPHLPVAALKHNAGELANAFYRQPDDGMFVAAITGTNGKTSCSQWLAAALSAGDRVSGVVGTLGTGIFRQGHCRQFDATGYTTPDAVQLQRALAKMRDAGISALAIEASSIGLEQGRLNGTHVDVALFTNLTQDHLDYHCDMAAYEAAKNILFDWSGLRHAVINLDDPMGRRLIQRMAARTPMVAVTGYTTAAETCPDIPVLRASEIRSYPLGTMFQIDSPFGSALVKTRLIGQFNVSNVLGVLGVLLAKGIAWKAAVEALESLTSVVGRMQQLGGEETPLVVIDYAHTPDALMKTLEALRPVAQQRGGQLWCVFGCGGERDSGKRAQMGFVSQIADHVVLTSDNPRSENATEIIQQILAGMQTTTTASSEPPQLIEDRAAAILRAVRQAAKRDVILLAGKGHEAYQEISGKRRPFLDADHAALALAARATMKGTV
jgi:UDP-N-acetylmuramoyl-L-alanyl-D-glutamate--2,6-diaminopimelate ligase